MKNAVSRNVFLLSVLLTGLYVLIDLLVDQEGDSGFLVPAHAVLGASVLVLVAVLVAWGQRTRGRGEALLREAREASEARVRERTAELQRANEQLQAEISERARVEQALRISEETARALMNASFESAVLIDTRGIALVANETFARSMGLAAEQMAGVSVFDLFPPEVAATRRRYLEQVVATGLPVHFEDVRESRSIDSHLQPVPDADGNVIRVAAFAQDVTDRKQAETALRASEEKYRLLFENMGEGFALYELICDPNGQPVDWEVLEVNRAYTRHTGTEPSRIVGHRASELFPEAIPEYLPRFAGVVASGTPSSFETFAKAAGRHQRVSTFPAGGKRFANTIADISERWQTEQELRNSEEKFAKVFQFSPDAIVLVREHTGVVLDVNEAFTKLVGHERSRVIGATWRELGILPPSGAPSLAELYRATGQVTDLEFDLTTRSGGSATVLMSLIPLLVNDEPCFMVIAHDITARKRSDEALRKAQAELARGIEARVALEERQRLSRELHDSVSQALYGVTLGINTARALFDADREKTLEALDYALSLSRAGLSEMRALIFELRPASLETEGLVVALAKQAEALRARHGLEIELSLCEEPALPLPIKEALYRIAREALQNAIKHAQSGRLDVRLECTNETLRLEVCDNGVGFNPSGEYPGHLGLHSMRERAEALGGRLEIVSAPDCGTQIVVSIPLATAALAGQ